MQDKKQPNIPPLRFAGFTEEWEEKQLGELGNWDKGQPLGKGDLNEEYGIPCIHYGELFVYEAIIEKVRSKTLLPRVVSSSGNDILFPDSDVTPDGLGRCSALEQRNVILGAGINILRLQESHKAPFCSCSIIKNKKQIISRVTGTTVRHIHPRELSEVTISLPSLGEQEQIGAFFRALDELIGAKEEELEKLRQMKAALLEAMFPSDENQINVNGGGYKYIDVKSLSEDLYLSAGSADTPRLRFRGFTDPWENKFITDVCNVSTGDKNTQDRDDKGIYPFYVRSSVVERINSYTYDGEAILTAGDGDIGKVFHLAKGKFGVHQRVYMLTEIHCNIQFLFQFFSAHLYERVSSLSAKNTVDSIRKDMITKMPISLPSLAEQERIGEFFRQQDEGIAAAKEQIDKLQAMKQACLERMFA